MPHDENKQRWHEVKEYMMHLISLFERKKKEVLQLYEGCG